MHLSGLFVYPVKSLRGCAVDTAEIDSLGVGGDRRFMVVDADNRFLTQRALPRMALITTALDDASLTLSVDKVGTVRVSRDSDPAAPLRQVSVWKSENLLAEDCGDDAAAWLGDFLRVKCRLVRIGEKFHRPVLKPAARAGDVVNFADACPFLLVNEASLADLNDRLAARGEEAVPMNRFRPNLVVSGGGPFAEDAWPRVRIGDVVFRTAGPSARCTITTTDQLTGERGPEPLRTLATYRRDPSDPTNVNFGQNLLAETRQGTLHVGDVLSVLPA